MRTFLRRRPEVGKLKSAPLELKPIESQRCRWREDVTAIGLAGGGQTRLALAYAGVGVGKCS